MSHPYVGPPPLAPREGTQYENPELRAYIHQQIQQKLNQMNMHVTPEYINDAINVYMQPGSTLRQRFFKAKADEAAGQARQASLGGDFGDVAERTLRDVGTGLAKGITAPGFFVAKHLGLGDDVAASEQALRDASGEGMGGRGLSSNPVLGTLQSAVEPAAEMYGNAKMIGNRAFQAGGTALSKAAAAFPESKVLAALAPKADAGVMANLLPSAAQGVFSSAVSMPGQTFSPEGAGYAAGMGALGALSHASGGAEAGAGMGSLLDRIRSSKLNQVFEPTQTPSTAAPAEAPTIAPIAAPAPAGPVTPRAEVEAQASQLPVDQQASTGQATAVPDAGVMGLWEGGTDNARRSWTGQEGLTKTPWEQLTPELQQKVRLATGYAKAPTTASPRAAALPAKKPMTGGDKVDFSRMAPEDFAKVQQAFQTTDRSTLLQGKDAQDPRLVEAAQNAQSVEDLPGFMQRRLIRTTGIGVKQIQTGNVVEGTTQPPPTNVVAGQALEKAGLIGPGEGAAIKPTVGGASPRKAVLPAKQSLDPAQAEQAQEAAAVTPSLAEQVAAARAENERLKGGVTPVVGKASARGAAVPTAPIETPAKAAVEGEAPPEAPSKGAVTAGWWDSEHATPEVKIQLLNKLGLNLPDNTAKMLSGMQYMDLPAPIRQRLPQQEQPIQSAGGAPGEGAGFPKRRVKGARVPGNGDIPETDPGKPKRRLRADSVASAGVGLARSYKQYQSDNAAREAEPFDFTLPRDITDYIALQRAFPHLSDFGAPKKP